MGRNQYSGNKPENFKGTFKKLFQYCKPERILLIIAVCCAVGGSILNLQGPGRLSDITDTITEGLQTGVDTEKLAGMFAALIAIYAGGFLLTYLQSFLMATVTQGLSKRMRKDVDQKINKVPMGFFNKISYGDVLSRVTNDVDTIGQTLNQSVASLVSSATMFLGALLMMLLTNVWMTLAAVAAALLGFVVMILIVQRSQKYFMQQQKNLGAMNGHVEEIYSGHNVVKVYNGEKNAREKFNQINESLGESAFRSQMFSGLMRPIMASIGNLGYVAVCVVGAALAMNGKISFGVIVAFMMYVRQFTQPLQQFAQGTTNLQSAAAASERVFEFLEEEEMADESKKTKRLDQVKGNVEFQHVRFAYDQEKGDIIHDFSAQVKAGQKIAIVGPTGAGKSTIVNLLMRFFEINGGSILIDGVPISQLTRENVHELFCMVLQDTWLFEGTIKENIVYCKEGVSDEKITEACKAVGLHHFIKTLPKGYDTVLGDEMSLSAGQKQQLTIARAMVEDAPMLILDEATSSIDTRTEIIIQNAMDMLMKGRTSFVIAHRLSTIKNADLILVLKDGDIIESGNHQELMEKGGFYMELYNSQFQKAS
ncbi:MAG TPA: ABC transporter ATP-binding protein [Candidatus Egerieimonas intestinavium]|uniref:ABC transporter ATP-binding protein n=1 Tax=Candidatus Egerieimonas intestinavium TaxID=2840777 RepID=A0A9D1ELX0_9FIRM|nr:ABC transporter ATP-binding protein [Candidatus Egerieimonas intestinavium]